MKANKLNNDAISGLLLLLSSSKDFGTYTETLTERLEIVLDFEYAAIIIPSSDENFLRRSVFFNKPMNAVYQPSEFKLHYLHKNPFELAIKFREATAVDSFFWSSQYKSEMIGQWADFQQQLFLPIYNGEKFLGVVQLGRSGETAFSEEDLTFLKILSVGMAVSFEMMIVREDLNESVGRSEKLNELNRIFLGIRSRVDFNLMVKLHLHKILGFGEFTITQVNHEEQIFGEFYSEMGALIETDPKMKVMREMNHKYPDGFYEKIITSSTPQIFNISDLMQTTPVPKYISYLNEIGILQIMGVNLHDGKKPLGTIFLFSRPEERFRKQTAIDLMNISGQLTAAMSNIFQREQELEISRQQSLLISFAENISWIEDDSGLHRIIAEKLHLFLDYSDIFVFKLDRARNTFSPYIFHTTGYKRNNIPEALNSLGTVTPNCLPGLVDDRKEPNVLTISDLEERQSLYKYLPFFKSHGIEKVMTMPLKEKGDLIGFIMLAADDSTAFNIQDRNIFYQFSLPFSVAGAKLAQLEALKKNERERSVLNALSKDLATLKGEQNILHIIQSRFESILFFNGVVISLINDDGITHSPLMVAVEKKMNDHDLFIKATTVKLPMDDGTYIPTIEADGPLVFYVSEFDENGNNADYVKVLKDSNVFQFVGIALRNKDATIGVMYLMFETQDTITSEELDLIKGISYETSIAVSNLLAYEDIRQREKEKSTLLALSKEISSIRDKQGLFNVINNQLREIIDFNDFTICLLNADGETHSVFLYNPGEMLVGTDEVAQLSAQKFNTNDGISNVMVASDDPQFFNMDELMTRPNVPDWVTFMFGNGIREMIGISLGQADKKSGFFCLYSSTFDAFNTSQYSLIKGICSQISVAIANIIANDMISQQLEEITNYRKQLEEENQYLQTEIDTVYNYSEIIGKSPEIEKVYHMVSQVALTDATVLVLGETGTGKELIARAIHNNSPRKDKLMVKVNCAALPAALIESELFGHEKGSFTGAHDKRIGKFELANHGTLFLDEVGELPLELQSKLLRAIQEKEIERLGGKGSIFIDVRIIAATNRDLRIEVAEGRFRSDLYYRLHVFPITLPPLRDRQEDISLLAYHFLDRYNRKFGKNLKGISYKVIHKLMMHDWPGNIRELEHLIERSVLLNSGTTLTNAQLPLSLERDDERTAAGFISSIDENERAHILRALKKCSGRIYGFDGAAELLKVPPTTLSSKMKRLGITKEHI